MATGRHICITNMASDGRNIRGCHPCLGDEAGACKLPYSPHSFSLARSLVVLTESMEEPEPDQPIACLPVWLRYGMAYSVGAPSKRGRQPIVKPPLSRFVRRIKN